MCTIGEVYQQYDGNYVMIILVAKYGVDDYVCYIKCDQLYVESSAILRKMSFIVEALVNKDSKFTVELLEDFLNSEVDMDGDARHIAPKFRKIK